MQVRKGLEVRNYLIEKYPHLDRHDAFLILSYALANTLTDVVLWQMDIRDDISITRRTGTSVFHAEYVISGFTIERDAA